MKKHVQKFKLQYKNQFVCFSPERFVQIKNNTIATFPYEGTIDAKIKNAKALILNDEKESRACHGGGFTSQRFIDGG